MNIERLDHLVLPVADIDRTCEFYTRVLGISAKAARLCVLASRRSTCTRSTGFPVSSQTSRPPDRAICALSRRCRSPR